MFERGNEERERERERERETKGGREAGSLGEKSLGEERKNL